MIKSRQEEIDDGVMTPKPAFKCILTTVTRDGTRKKGVKTLTTPTEIIANDQFVNYQQE